MRCELDPRERCGCQGPREVRVLAAVEGRPGRHAGRRAHLQAEDRRVLGAVADAGHRRRGAPRRLRRRHMDSPRLRGADSLQRRVRAVVAPCPLGDEARLAVAALPHRPARHGRDRRWQRLFPRNGPAQGCRDVRFMRSPRSSATRRPARNRRRASSFTAWHAICCTSGTSGRRSGGPSGSSNGAGSGRTSSRSAASSTAACRTPTRGCARRGAASPCC